MPNDVGTLGSCKAAHENETEACMRKSLDALSLHAQQELAERAHAQLYVRFLDA